MSRNPVKESINDKMVEEIKKLKRQIEQLKYNQNSKLSGTFTFGTHTVVIVEGIIISVV